MCCGGKVCMLCTCLVLLVVLIGMLFGFGVFKHGFHKLEDTLHVSGGAATTGRPFLGFAAPPPF